jgi:cell division protein FtsI/penicillin-binding protein 2
MEEGPKTVSQKLARLLVSDASDKKELLEESMRLEGLLLKDGAYIPLKHRVQTSVKRNIDALKIQGIGFENNEIRYYPEASTSAQLLGFVGKDEAGGDLGYFGLEGYYNLPLSGRSGFTLGQKDAGGAPILLDPSKKISATAGVDLVTNIDKRIQLLIEDKLKTAIRVMTRQNIGNTIMRYSKIRLSPILLSPEVFLKFL